VSSSPRTEDLVRNISTIVVLSIVLGLVLQVAIVTTRAIFGADSPSWLPETVGSVSWALIVCFGVAAGTTIMRSTATTAGIIALIFTPIALAAAKAAQKGMTVLLGQPAENLSASIFLIAAIKAIQYGFLSYVLVILTRRGSDSLRPYLLFGIGVGLTFGLLLTFIAAWTADPAMPTAKLASTTVNEVLFPLGCVIAIYIARSVARLAEDQREPADTDTDSAENET
jgi:hypothetical protein